MSLPDMSPVSPANKNNHIIWQNQQIICGLFVTFWAIVVPTFDKTFYFLHIWIICTHYAEFINAMSIKCDRTENYAITYRLSFNFLPARSCLCVSVCDDAACVTIPRLFMYAKMVILLVSCFIVQICLQEGVGHLACTVIPLHNTG